MSAAGVPMSEPAEEPAPAAFRHPDTPKRAGASGDTWRRTAPAGPPAAAPEPASARSWPGGSPALRDALSRATAAAAAAAASPLTPRHPAAAAAAPAHVNPFECDDMMTSLSLPTSSPSLFECVTSPNDKEEPGLDLEQRAQLFPAHIDVTPYHKQLLCQKYDPLTEMQVQTAIDRFFSSERIVPSPWSAGGGPRRAPLVTGCEQSPLAGPEQAGGPARRDCGSQTLLTLPAQLPAELERALAPYLCAETEDRSQSPQDDDSMLSNSTLRRKLLFHNAGGDLPSNDVSMADPDGSMYHFPGTPEKGHLLPTSPPSASRPRTSVPHRPDVDSPPVSPICKSMLASPSTSSIKSQGLAKIRYPSSDLSEPSDDEECAEAVGGSGGGGGGAVGDPAAADSLADQTAPQDTGYHSTLASLPSLSARHLAAAESSQLARLIGSGSASMLHSTRLEGSELAPPGAEGEGAPAAPVPIGSSTPSRGAR